MNTDHPDHLYSQSAPILDDAALLNQVAQQIASCATSIEEEIRITELIVILFEQQAERADHALATVQRLYPQAQTSAIYQVIVEPTRHTLQTQAQQASSSARLYRTRLQQLRSMLPLGESNPATLPTSVLHAFNHLCYPLGTLMQTLPGDITNTGSLNPEQRQMCQTVAALAYHAQETLLNGVEALGSLLALADKWTSQAESSTLAHAGALVKWLTTESRFMAQNAAEYGAAARNVRQSEG